MRAVRLHEIDRARGPEHFRVEQVDDPSPQPGEALVKLRRAAFNRRDVFISQGLYPGIQLPCIPGSDGLGTVAAHGEGASGPAVGARVVIDPTLGWGPDQRIWLRTAQVLGMPHQGTFAEYIAVPAGNVHPAPASLSDDEAAAIPLAGVTAYRALVSRGGCTKDDVVLIPAVDSRYFFLPLLRGRVVDRHVGAHRFRARELRVARRGDDRLRTDLLGEQQHERLHAAADAGDQHDVVLGAAAARDERAVGGDAGERDRRGFVVAERGGCRVYVARRDRDVLGEGSLVRHPEHLSRAQPDALIGAPAEGRIDDDARADRRSARALAVRGDGAETVGAGNARELNPRVEPLADEDVAAIERSTAELDQRLTRLRRRIVDLLDAKMFGTALAVDLVKADGSHPGTVREPYRERLPPTVNDAPTTSPPLERTWLFRQ